jgi:hypothetical protein
MKISHMDNINTKNFAKTLTSTKKSIIKYESKFETISTCTRVDMNSESNLHL